MSTPSRLDAVEDEEQLDPARSSRKVWTAGERYLVGQAFEASRGGTLDRAACAELFARLGGELEEGDLRFGDMVPGEETVSKEEFEEFVQEKEASQKDEFL